MAGVLEYSPVAGSNSAINGIAILGSSSIKFGDDALRQILADQAAALTRNVNKAAGTYTALKADHNQLWRATGAVTINLTAAATLTDGWCLWVKAEGGTVTIDPNSSETIDGAATLTLPDGASACVRCTGSTFVSLIFSNTVDPLNRYLDFWLSNNVADATNDIDITDQKGVIATLTKRLDAAWTVGTNQGGLDTGSIANTTYHVWLIRRPDTGVVDGLFSASATSPTMPANYTQKRRIGSILRAAGAIVAFVQRGDSFLRASVVDRNSTAALASSLISLSVPTGIIVEPIVSIAASANASSLYSLSIGGGSVGSSAFILIGQASGTSAAVKVFHSSVVESNTSGQIYFSVVISSGTIFSNTLTTLGWIDRRGQDGGL